ncbi:hypothetical protein GCM10010168_48710 [Actinoplanes ianthinogenes]|uniref:Alpha-L-arabinofuranosidase B arabinose-binding domain-containing protein n=1 Tax=Actinoplanes ianthinogenes TaxID=122358 RepID=A0ABM7LNP7_9ACTN|nr:AbfB domain-containing protein [Actinoplanes ianthinogenes]BCJ40830.1 hypothetical protein Aiant_14870 [Actinoplanes ianthinogenes]GGR24929.1 hypothetical protein GCM10010168_48710 [Actinoplanes ianthinogenes]
MPEDDTRSGLRVGRWVPPYSPDGRPRKTPIRPTTPPSFPPPPIPGFPAWPRHYGTTRRRAALAAVAAATVGAAVVSALALRGGDPTAEPEFLTGTVPPAPPPAQTVVIAPISSSNPIPSTFRPGSAPTPTRSRTSKPVSHSPTPSPSPDVTLRVGSTVALTVADRPGYRVRHSNFLGRIDPIGSGPDAPDRPDSSFTVRGGPANSGCVSLESVNFPGYFLRHQNFEIKLHRRDGSDLFDQDATFCPIVIRSGAALTLRSINYPDMFVVEDGDRLFLRKDGALALVPQTLG